MGRPIFWPKGHVAEDKIGQHELHSHLRLRALIFFNVRDNTLQCSFCLDVRQSEPLSSIHLRGHENQRTMSTDRPRLTLFFKMQPNATLPAASNRNFHQYRSEEHT